MENRIKEQLMLFSDRTSTHYLRSNQLRLYFSSIAYVLLQMLRRLGLEGTELAKAQCATIRLKVLKIGALIRITVRKVWVSLAGGYPYVSLFRQVYEKLCAMPLKPLKTRIPKNFFLANLPPGEGVHGKRLVARETLPPSKKKEPLTPIPSLNHLAPP